jgi:hypothetical protein
MGATNQRNDLVVTGNASVTGDLIVADALIVDGDVTITGTLLADGVDVAAAIAVPAFTVADKDKQLTVQSTSQVTTVTPSAVTADGGTYLITVDGEDTTALAFSAANTDIETAIEVAVPALEDLVTVVGDISDATFTITFADARAHTVVCDGALLTGGDSPYTLPDVTTTPAVAEHLAWAAA